MIVTNLENNFMKLYILFFLIIFGFLRANSQSLSIFDIDTTNFPIIKAKFFAFDDKGIQIKPNISDFSITENGQPRTVTNVTCPSPKPPVPLSSVLIFDVSGSMSGSPFDMEKDIANSWVNMLNLGFSECAITSFSNGNYINQDFTTNKNKLINGINSLGIIGGTDYNDAMINPAAGGILMAKTGKHKRIIIFLTDGQPNFEPRIQEIIDEANKNDISIYCLSINMPAHQSMIEFSKQTGGIYFENIKSNKDAEDALRKIFIIIQNIEFCEIEWQSESICNSTLTNYKMKLSLLPDQINDTINYHLPNKAKSKLQFSPSYIVFKNISPGIKKDSLVTLTAYNTDFEVNNIISSNPLFTVSPTKFSLKAGESKDLIISYIPKDSNYSYSEFSIENNNCTAKFYSSGIFQGKKAQVNTLKLTKPNGGEEFIIGSDTLITWEGIPETDTVRLEYSFNNGFTWKTITDSASGLKYCWKNIPRPESNKCLVKVNQYENGELNDGTPQIEWQKTYGGSKNDYANSIRQTYDGGYIVAGYTFSNDGDVSNNNGDWDFWVIKLNSVGSVEWEKTYGNTGIECANSIQQTSDGGYIVAGYNYNYYYIIKLTFTGNMEWQNNYNVGLNGEAKSIQQTSDGGYIVAGFTYNYTEGYKYGIIKLKSDGTLDWKKTYGGSENDYAQSIHQTFDGGYIVAGYTTSNDGNVIGNHGKEDYWIIKLNSLGSLEWQKTYGGSNKDYAYSIQQTLDSGYIVAGYTSSNDGDVIGNHGNEDYWILKLNQKGLLQWQTTLGGSEFEQAVDVLQTLVSGYIVAGRTTSNDGNIRYNQGSSDFWIVKLDNSGSIIWQKTLGGNNNDYASSIQQTSDNGYIVTGWTNSDNGDISNNKGNYDYWVVKLFPANSTILLQEDISDSVFSIVAPHASANNIDMKDCLLGMVKDSVITNVIENIGTYPVRIDSLYFTGADSGNFRLLSHILPISIKPNDKISLEFGFGPSRVGLHSADMIILTQSDTLFKQIIGTGYQPQLSINSKILDFGEVYIGNERTFSDTVVIRNLSGVVIDIPTSYQVGPDKSQFAVLSGDGTFTLNPYEERKLTVRFKPSNAGRTTGGIAFEYNGVGSPAIVTLYGIGKNKEPNLQSNMSEIPNLICANVSEGKLTILNKCTEIIYFSEMNLKGNNSLDFSIPSFKPFILEPDSTTQVIIQFNPQLAGTKTTSLEIKSTAEPDSIININLTAKKDSINISSLENTINIGDLYITQPKDSSITLMNFGTLRTGATINGSTNIVLSKNEISLSENETIKILFKFKGQSIEGNITEKITIFDSVCNFIKEVKIFGNAIKAIAYATLQVGSLEAYPGDTIEIPINIIDKSNLEIVGIKSLNFDLSYNSTLLLPLNYIPEIIDNTTSKIKLTDLPISEYKIAKIKFVVGLGNAETSQLNLSNVEQQGGFAKITIESGTFKLLGICTEGGKRLINPNSKINISSIKPNPSDNQINVELQLVEKTGYKLLIVNSNGQTVREIFRVNSNKGVTTEDIEVIELASGVYNLILQTESEMISKRFLILK